MILLQTYGFRKENQRFALKTCVFFKKTMISLWWPVCWQLVMAAGWQLPSHVGLRLAVAVARALPEGVPHTIYKKIALRVLNYALFV